MIQTEVVFRSHFERIWQRVTSAATTPKSGCCRRSHRSWLPMTPKDTQLASDPLIRLLWTWENPVPQSSFSPFLFFIFLNEKYQRRTKKNSSYFTTMIQPQPPPSMSSPASYLLPHLLPTPYTIYCYIFPKNIFVANPRHYIISSVNILICVSKR